MKNKSSWLKNIALALKLCVSFLSIFAAVKTSMPAADMLSESLFRLSQESTVRQSGAPVLINTDSELTSLTAAEESSTQAEAASETVFETPADIRQMQSDYVAAFAGKTASGSVSEVFFVTNGATDCIGKVAVRNTTAEQKPDFAALIEQGAKLDIEDKTQPTVLIFHTHTTESYLLVDDGRFFSEYSTRSSDESRNMLRIGKEICSVLEENGIGYIHDTKIYDEYYNGAYSRSRVSVLEYLKQYPSIKIVLDVHRDAIYYSDTSRGKPVAEINGKKAAQIMIITGAQEGSVTDFPNWEDNLRFALTIQKNAQNMYEGLMKPIYFCQRKYNMDTALCSVLLEIGSDSNTLEEALYAAHMMGDVLSETVKQYSGGSNETQQT